MKKLLSLIKVSLNHDMNIFKINGKKQSKFAKVGLPIIITIYIMIVLGVYSFKLLENARVNDLIEKAGGLMKDADTSTINLSMKLEDEMAIVIYSKSEISNYTKTIDELNKKLELCENKIKNNACIKIQSETNNKVNIKEQKLTTFNRYGFAAIEWGGMTY